MAAKAYKHRTEIVSFGAYVTIVDDITSILSHRSPFDDPSARRDEVARLGILILIGNIMSTRFGGNDVAGF
jgi:hypothetical protein